MRAHDPEGNLVQRRPAESAGVLAAVTVLVAMVVTGSYDLPAFAQAVAVILVAVVPALVTAYVSRTRG